MSRSRMRCWTWWSSPQDLRLSQFQPHPVIAGHDVIGQALPDHLVVEIGMHVGDDRAPRLEALDPGQRVAQAEMARMGRVTQAIDDPQIELLEQRPARFWNIADVGR